VWDFFQQWWNEYLLFLLFSRKLIEQGLDIPSGDRGSPSWTMRSAAAALQAITRDRGRNVRPWLRSKEVRRPCLCQISESCFDRARALSTELRSIDCGNTGDDRRSRVRGKFVSLHWTENWCFANVGVPERGTRMQRSAGCIAVADEGVAKMIFSGFSFFCMKMKLKV
jgi:hypothetical protein